MSKIAVVTDTNGSIDLETGKQLGLHILPMPFFIDEKLYFDGIDLTEEEFYAKLAAGSNVSTSQPSPADLTEFWDKLLEKYDVIVHIPMSSGLSASCETAMGLARDYDGRVQVVDNQRISLTQKSAALDALELIKSGKSAEEVKAILEEKRAEASVYVMVDTLEYLKKGGRITPAAAMIGSVLKLKPILQLKGDKLDAFSKARGQKAAKKVMTDAMKEDFKTKFADAVANKKLRLGVCHSSSEQEANIFAEEIAEIFPGIDIEIASLPLSIACHTGPGALAILAMQQI